jgi:hypothetical protein
MHHASPISYGLKLPRFCAAKIAIDVIGFNQLVGDSFFDLGDPTRSFEASLKKELSPCDPWTRPFYAALYTTPPDIDVLALRQCLVTDLRRGRSNSRDFVANKKTHGRGNYSILHCSVNERRRSKNRGERKNAEEKRYERREFYWVGGLKMSLGGADVRPLLLALLRCYARANWQLF